MFFKIHNSAKIGCKLLSNADLGIGESSHQTHIGLFEGTLDFIKDYYQQSFAQFIYNDTVKELVTFLDPILNPDGSQRSPKIRTGSKSELKNLGVPDINTVVKEIRDIASKNPNIKYYLMWFGLDTNDIVFFLFDEKSNDYSNLSVILGKGINRLVLSRENKTFSDVIKYLDNKINDVNIEYLEELESIIQQGEDIIYKPKNRIKIRKYDIDKAKINFQEIGKKGENLVNNYLCNKKQNGEILDFNWLNKDKESYAPYDFKIQDIGGNILYVDVKTTGYKFDQDMFFSGTELQFIQQEDNYQIYRVYNTEEGIQLKICDNIYKVSNNFCNPYFSFSGTLLLTGIKVNSIKLGVSPGLNILNFNDSIKL